MIKGLAITPPVVGRISIGMVVEKNGKRLPEKDDQFTITTQVQNKDGWVLHPLDKAIRTASDGKIRAIPIQLMFNDPDLNLRAEYSLFDRETGRPICVGNGETCKRVGAEGMQSLPCPSPSSCSWGGKAGCKPYGRLNVLIAEQEDAFGSFIFRTTGFNSIRTLSARLSYFKAVSGGLLSCMPLTMRLRGKSTTQSHRAAVYYVDITTRDGMKLNDAVAEARAQHETPEVSRTSTRMHWRWQPVRDSRMEHSRKLKTRFLMCWRSSSLTRVQKALRQAKTRAKASKA